jgi:excinuclease ABC subunit C
MVFADQAELFAVDYAPGCLRLELQTCLGPCAAACSHGDYTAQVRAARSFLAGTDITPLATLEKDMLQAAADQQFERAAVLRDKLAALSWLHRHLDQLRQAATMAPLVYPVMGHDGATRWYLIHGGRAVAAAPAPSQPEEVAATLVALLARRPTSINGGEHLAGILLLAAWMRKHPQERERMLSLTAMQAPC